MMGYDPKDRYIPIDAAQIEDFRAQLNKWAREGYTLRYNFMKPGYYCAMMELKRR